MGNAAGRSMSTHVFGDRRIHHLVRHVYAKERRRWQCMRCLNTMQVLLGITVICFTGLLMVWCVLVHHHGFMMSPCAQTPPHVSASTMAELFFFLSTSLILTLCVASFAFFAWSPSLRLDGGVVGILWASNSLNVAARYERCADRSELFSILSWAFAIVFNLLYFDMAFQGILQLRKYGFVTVTSRFLLDGTRLCTSVAMIVVFFVGVFDVYLENMKSFVGFEVLGCVSSYVVLFSFPTLMYFIMKYYRITRSHLMEIATAASSTALADMHFMLRRSALTLPVVGLCCVTQVTSWTYRLLRWGGLCLIPRSRKASVEFHLIVTSDILIHAIVFALLMLGRVREEKKMHSTSDRIQKRWFMASASWQPNKNEAWHAKVTELAGRGFTLEALLSFYGGLGSACMHHYVARRHRTVDVVRMAIIPESHGVRSALAPVMMNGAYTRPRALVTHNWDNLFRDLVAAVVADALGEHTFATIAYLLERDFKLVEQAVRDAGVQQNTYWICAFSVNQHSGICSDNPQATKDPVLTELHPTCSCGTPKAWNDTMPTLEDGRGIECEMNKFDDMLRYLSATDKDFRQVIAIDTSCCIFSRAWCVAEIVAAIDMGMRQSCKIKSHAVFAFHEHRLRQLKVEEMSASRPEDRKQILDSIQDEAAFNFRLNEALHGMCLGIHDIAQECFSKRMEALFRWSSLCTCRASLRGCLRADATEFDLDLVDLIGRPQGLDVRI
eukprot:TRINITY_DN18023_c0_g1_i1.p1 TRINITY_DN18023_c0_g1~~TRINITY_DN18023_c0_g1_i1.p1  ORF type:complete len:725 (-),score=65.72 TRINITY_DN18023_c0_g1_i1:92-2266(-)